MHDNPNPDPIQHALMGLLLEDRTLWSLAELHRSLTPANGDTPTKVAPAIEDAVEDLYAAGLVHRIGNYVFATRAAHAAERLAG